MRRYVLPTLALICAIIFVVARTASHNFWLRTALFGAAVAAFAFCHLRWPGKARGISKWRDIVVALAREKLPDFRIEGVREEYNGSAIVLILERCEVTVWYDKSEVGSWVRPISADGTIRYAYKAVAETSLPYGLLGLGFGQAQSEEAERQLDLIARDYRGVLEGDFGDWPLQR
jgi:hypothetical protein